MHGNSAGGLESWDSIGNYAACGLARMPLVDRDIPNMLAEVCLLLQSLDYF